ncbi:MAG: RlmE family RNA methyltransferase [Spirochaetes bacterium]|nr:RlmE family RNA methyltransferase [Spirochaetota bacterium]
MKDLHDRFYRKAKEEHYLARSVYKLQEALEKFNFIRASDRVLDVGCSPGSWSQFLLRKTLTTGSVTGIDVLPAQISHPRFTFIHASIAEIDAAELTRGGGMFDVVLSDAMVNTNADPESNHYRSVSLCRKISLRLPELLKQNGMFFFKVFDGPDLQPFRKELTALFSAVSIFKPQSSRDESRELFLFCRSKR